jgi:hypothetical protein
MTNSLKVTAVFLLLNVVYLFSACGGQVETPADVNVAPTAVVEEPPVPEPSPTPAIPNLQAEILDGRYKETNSPLGSFDFKNYTYPLPRGWQDPNGRKAELVNGKREMSREEKRIGLSYVTTRFFDATGDGEDEAFVVLKIDTGGAAIPQIVYVFRWNGNEPELIWYFRTGDRSDGGLKDFRPENGEVVVELYGQDRYIIGELDTMKITGDEEQICCPTHFTRSRYKWNGSSFRLQGKRLTFSTADPNAPPVENMIEVVEKQNSGKK